MTRGTVAKYGNCDFTNAIMDGMAAAKLERENNNLKMREANWGVHDVIWRRKIKRKITRARRKYGDNYVLPRFDRAILGIYGLIVYAIHLSYKKLQAKNRAV
jgi:hypothetical protein